MPELFLIETFQCSNTVLYVHARVHDCCIKIKTRAQNVATVKKKQTQTAINDGIGRWNDTTHRPVIYFESGCRRAAANRRMSKTIQMPQFFVCWPWRDSCLTVSFPQGLAARPLPPPVTVCYSSAAPFFFFYHLFIFSVIL